MSAPLWARTAPATPPMRCSAPTAMLRIRRRSEAGSSRSSLPKAAAANQPCAAVLIPPMEPCYIGANRINTRDLNMSAQSLGYLGVRAKDLGDWGTYGSKMLGLQCIDKSACTMAFRMDD